MNNQVKLQANDGHDFHAYFAQPEGTVKGGLVVVQEIFGVNAHIRSVVDSYARDGYLTIAPSIFDRIEPGIELNYTTDTPKAFELYGKLDPKTALLDVAAAFQHVASARAGAAVVGFCYGGLMAWLSATRGADAGFSPKCTIGYYAGGIGNVASETPKCPVMLHFGANDNHIGPEQVDAVRRAHPEVQIFTYEEAGHAFNRDVDPKSFHPEAATLARRRTLDFLEKHLK